MEYFSNNYGFLKEMVNCLPLRFQSHLLIRTSQASDQGKNILDHIKIRLKFIETAVWVWVCEILDIFVQALHRQVAICASQLNFMSCV